MPVTAEIRAIFSATQSVTLDAGGPAVAPILLDKILPFASGTGANQADLVWQDTRTLAASGTEDLDLAGVLLDAFGATITAAELVAIMVVADAANTNDVVLGAATQAIPLFGGTNGTFAVKPGGLFLIAAPSAAGQLTIGAGSTDDLKVANSSSGTSVTYTILILARTA
jgi:hypothetical protein